MERFSGIKIRDILLDKQNWWNFYLKYKHLIRIAIIINVCKVLMYKTKALGFHLFKCPSCKAQKKVFHTCKSRFCSSCGKKATEQWVSKNLSRLPQVPWQHITFTLPEELRDFFWLNRNLFNLLIPIPAKIITQLGKSKHLIPGIFLAVHTFGRDLKPNVHFHVSITCGGLSLNHQYWVNKFYLYHQTVKDMWKYAVINQLRNMAKNHQLRLPPQISHITTYAQFNQWLNMLYQKSWVVHLQIPSANHYRNVKYLGNYLKRPPIAETRINKYDGESVTYSYHDHEENCTSRTTLSVEDFIKRIIKHIPDNNFRVIRYYNWLSNRTCGGLLPLVFQLINQPSKPSKKVTWYSLFYSSFGYDPLYCWACDIIMQLVNVAFPTKQDILSQHQKVATIIAL